MSSKIDLRKVDHTIWDLTSCPFDDIDNVSCYRYDHTSQYVCECNNTQKSPQTQYKKLLRLVG